MGKGFNLNAGLVQVLKSNFTTEPVLCDALRTMWTKFLKLLPILPILLITGCAGTTYTRLTAVEQPRNANNQYLVETSFASSQESLIWDSIKTSVVVGSKAYPMSPVARTSNRWEGYVPVPAGENSVNYRFRFDYKYNNFGTVPQPGTNMSPVYVLKVVD
jgi:hypothetical protein